MQRLYALRGATQCNNDADDIKNRIASLYDALLASNNLCEDDIASLIFSVTPDLTALNPAAALRLSNRGNNLALFSAMEPVYENSLPRTIRVLMHCYLNDKQVVKHIYQNGAEVLRPDRKG
ncbi:chorismate mutase [Spirochaetia bacterium]|nr:chorismate mutase [Spirochaetia bacterium]